MIGRIMALTLFFLRNLIFSLAGSIYIILTLVYWAVFFPPGQSTPDFDNYMLIIGAFGAVASFLATLTMATRAYRAENSPIVSRLPSRVEYITAVMLGALIFSFILQLVIGLLALVRGPEVSMIRFLDVPPLWISVSVLASVLALHASDMVASGWSRVLIFGLIALLLVGQSLIQLLAEWLAALIITVSGFFYGQDLVSIGNALGTAASWLRNSGMDGVGGILSALFWPFQATIDAIFGGSFSPSQALAPAVFLLYATILFLIAADLFATKDIDMAE